MNTIGRRAFLAQSGVAIGALLYPSILRSENTNSPQIYSISKAKKCIVNGSEYHYYKVNLDSDIPFHIVTNEKCTDLNPFFTSSEYRTMGKPFPQNKDISKSVALVEAKELGLPGNLEIYDSPEGYRVKYNFSPLIEIPSHTFVTPEYLFTMETNLSKLPNNLHKKLSEAGVKIILAKDPEDTYYHYSPYDKKNDLKKEPVKNGEWVGYKDGKWIDNRRVSHAPSRSNYLTVYSPEKHESFGGGLIDRKNNTKILRDVLLHELGHVISNINNRIDDYDFNVAFQADKRRLKILKNNDTAYAYTSKKEAFAEIVCCLLGGYSNERKRDTLCSLYECTEYIRTKILPDFGLKFSIDDIERITGDKYIAYR